MRFMVNVKATKDSESGAPPDAKILERTVIDGPFAETKELVAGFCLFQVKSKEIRQVYETADFGDEMTPEMKAKEDEMRRTLAARK